jgi:hypothetical protein
MCSYVYLVTYIQQTMYQQSIYTHYLCSLLTTHTLSSFDRTAAVTSLPHIQHTACTDILAARTIVLAHLNKQGFKQQIIAEFILEGSLHQLNIGEELRMATLADTSSDLVSLLPVLKEVHTLVLNTIWPRWVSSTAFKHLMASPEMALAGFTTVADRQSQHEAARHLAESLTRSDGGLTISTHQREVTRAAYSSSSWRGSRGSSSSTSKLSANSSRRSSSRSSGSSGYYLNAAAANASAGATSVVLSPLWANSTFTQRCGTASNGSSRRANSSVSSNTSSSSSSHRSFDSGSGTKRRGSVQHATPQHYALAAAIGAAYQQQQADLQQQQQQHQVQQQKQQSDSSALVDSTDAVHCDYITNATDTEYASSSYT